MLKNILWLTLVTVAACGQAQSSQPAAVSVDNLEINVPPHMSRKDYKKLSTLRPTTYYVPQEKEVDCKGNYGQGNPTYNGTEKSDVLDLSGQVIATVCTRFYKTLLMEGTAILKDRGHGEISINYGGEVGGQKRFHELDRCAYGEGTQRDLCLLPYHTLAADNKAHKIGDIIYIPKADGLALPDGSLHEGFFVVRDTGGAFNGVGASRVDMFTGTDPDNANVFRAAGFDKNKPMDAYKINGDSADQVKQRLKDKFGVLY